MIVVMTGKIRSRDPTPVGSLLRTAVPKLAERLLEVRIHREWRELVGPDMARRCQPGELRSGTLDLTVDNSPWLQELALREAELRSRLTSRYGPDAVRSLRLTLGTLGAEPAEPPRRGARRKDDPTAEEMRMIEAAVSLIPDPDLQVSARRLLEKACVAVRARTSTP